VLRRGRVEDRHLSMSDRTPISPRPLRTLRADALPAYVSNGLVGLRVERQPLLGGSAIVSGFAGRSPVDGVEGFTTAPYPVYGDVRIGETWLSRVATAGELVEIRHDFATAELTSRWHYEIEGVGLDVDHVVFCSRTLATLVAHEVTVTTDRPARLAIRTGIDPFLLGWPAPADVEERTFRLAVDEQAPKYVGTPMMSTMFAVYAARLGRRDQAADLLERGYAAFVDDPFNGPDEFPAYERDKPKANPMFANLGGYLTDLIFGFPGLDLSDDVPASWTRRAACPPAGWDGISIERLWNRGRPMRLTARHGEPARVEPQPWVA
jgi:hypothetical protein